MLTYREETSLSTVSGERSVSQPLFPTHGWCKSAKNTI